MSRYAGNIVWEGLAPIPQKHEGATPLATIAYKEEYVEAMSYLRAVMAVNECSERALSLTEDIIRMNPAHYTVWLYRCKIIFTLNKSLCNEIEWVNNISLKYLKNYQIWHHRQTIIDKLGSAEGETAFIDQMLEKDAKNYHVWSYRQWLVKRFDLWNQMELDFVKKLLEQDLRNNSAWNHRFFVVFGKPNTSAPTDKAILGREKTFAEEAIRKAPQNQSPWNYLRGIYRQSKESIVELSPFVREFCGINENDLVQSSHALDVFAEIHGDIPETQLMAAKALDLLAMRYDPIRVNYWNYRKRQIEDQTTVAA
ncbi:farnesyltransferas-like protein [Pseudovirgaria hyperparasitica]|uniref:Protein farnesyltransferase/geranylgeranyltransferase type-1 subunit alpha n=1 Tax=Pseudovirgaria hyperparasitica TaxID=470096 RepID=A0A6A6VRI8_9PEZI|nr:farnesyltransferas-like protein [Pseudovirgaria hyperparasitica]KAF2752813.1 farnesyltransferas-like protein [Pseudovirgaria hyperparasitica]